MTDALRQRLQRALVPAMRARDGAAVGLGAAEVDRRELTEGDVRSILHAEVSAHLEAADHLASVGQAARAVELRAMVAALRPFLDG